MPEGTTRVYFWRAYRLSRKKTKEPSDVLERFHPAVRTWFIESFGIPTEAQILGWPAISGGDSTLILAPTGSGKTLTAFLWCIDRLMFSPEPPAERRCRAIYISPLKALAVDVERNLRAPIAGIASVASRTGETWTTPTIATRTGDTSPADRARFGRHSADILITTPESLYLLLTSNAREMLRSVETVIIDEIHALVPTKRGSHLALSLERLEALCERSPQRIGLSATQKPLEEVARFLAGAEQRPAAPAPPPEAADELISFSDEFAEPGGSIPTFRTVSVVDTGERKKLSLIIETPVEEMGSLGAAIPIPSGAASSTVRTSIWPAIHPRLLELIRSHRSTLIFVNSRRLAERLAGALNELAGESIVSAHHGSVAREQRSEIEDNLKSGRIPALVATSSLELGIDMGAIDLVIQIEAPPSIASGMQRIGRASHQVGATSEGILFPKHRADLVACAAVTGAMREGKIEPIRYPRNPLDVLAQQIVAMVSMDSWKTDELFATVRSAAPFAELTPAIFEGVLDMLSGLYPSDDFAELRPRLTWNRLDNTLTARPGAKRVAVTNGGTIPDRGLYGVFMAGAEKGSARVGELDEEMVFESRPGETFMLGASTWRIEEITHDRVLVTPAPGEPGKMPFWHGDSAGRSVQLGERIGALIRTIGGGGGEKLVARLSADYDLNAAAARNLVEYVADQKSATEAVPDDRTILIERCPDDLGDWRVCVLSPFGGRVHAPWAMAATAKVRRETGIEVETMWSDDGFIIRFPETDEAPDVSMVIPSAEEVESLVIRQLGSSAMFAAKFREIATRALLLPRRTGNRRSPLWQQRKRSADLLQVAARYGSFPMLLETYRECLQDVFDMPALIQLLQSVERRTTRTVTADTLQPSPFAGSVLFRYVANYIYDGDAPLAERRAQALAIDHSQLRELLGEAELRDLLDADALAETERRLQHLEQEYRAKSPDQIHDMLLSIGDLTREELAARCLSVEVAQSAQELITARRIIETAVGGERRLIAVEDAARYRDALGAPIPHGLPERLLEPVRDPLGDLVSRYARTHGPFTLKEIAARFALGPSVVESPLRALLERGRLIEGEFRPGGMTREWCDANVLRLLRRRSLAKLRHEVEPVEPRVLARLFTAWQGIGKKRQGLNALLEVIESLQGCPLPASIFESEILAARLEDYRASDLDTLTAAGEVAWTGVEALGERDGRIAIYLTDTLPLLHSPAPEVPLSEVETRIVEYLGNRGASFFPAVHLAIGDGFPQDTVDALWDLVWKGFVTNDTVHSLRAFTRAKTRGRTSSDKRFRSRRASSAPPAAEGRWSLTADLIRSMPNRTARSAALASQLLNRYGVLTREAAPQEQIVGGFSAVYDVLKQMEEAGKVRRGYFIDGVAATQFALPGALDLLRSLRIEPDEPVVGLIAATDPANPWGGILSWPPHPESVRPTRSVGARVLLVNGVLAAYISRGEKQIYTWIPEDEPERSEIAGSIATTLANLVRSGARRALLIAEVDGVRPDMHSIGPWLTGEGFVPTSMGYQMRALPHARMRA